MTSGKLDDATLAALTADDLVSSLLVIHGLHPQDLETRVAAALDSVRPYLGSHGGNVELMDISAGGRGAAEAARHLPGLPVVVRHAQVRRRGGHRIRGAGGDGHRGRRGGKTAATPALIPVDALLVRVNHSRPERRARGRGLAAT